MKTSTPVKDNPPSSSQVHETSQNDSVTNTETNLPEEKKVGADKKPRAPVMETSDPCPAMSRIQGEWWQWKRKAARRKGRRRSEFQPRVVTATSCYGLAPLGTDLESELIRFCFHGR